ncbi:24478_t:CDS:2, partial [Entrophospora sp. SA101]
MSKYGMTLEDKFGKFTVDEHGCNSTKNIENLQLIVQMIGGNSILKTDESFYAHMLFTSFEAQKTILNEINLVILMIIKITNNDNKNNDELKSIEEEEITYLSTLTPPSSPSKKTVTGIKSPYFSQVQQINYNNNDDDGDNFMAKLQHSLNGNKINDTTDKNNNGKTFKYFSGKFSATRAIDDFLILRVLDISKNKNEPTSTSI